jgi:hypothetical protein
MDRTRIMLLVVAPVVLVAIIVSPRSPNTLTAQGALTPAAYLPVMFNCWHWTPFSADSPWNTPIGPSPEIDPNSSAMIHTLAASQSEGRFYINIDGWTIPVYYADADTPTFDVPCTSEWGCGPGFGQDVPIPNGAVPDPQEDAHMAVVDLSRRLSFDMWGAEAVGSGWQTRTGFTFDLDGTGVRPDGVGSARGSGFPLLAGLIRLQEIQCGNIDHALVMAYDYPRANVYVYPASMTDGRGGADAIPEGGRIQLDPTLDLNSLGLTPAAKVIARAMQEYGAFVGDNSGGIALYAEGLYGKPGPGWNGVLAYDDLANIPWDRFRVIKLPPLKVDPD